MCVCAVLSFITCHFVFIYYNFVILCSGVLAASCAISAQMRLGGMSELVTHSFTHSLIHSLTDSLTHSLIHSPTHPLNQSPTHSLTHPIAHSPIHSLTHSLIHALGIGISSTHSKRTPSIASLLPVLFIHCTHSPAPSPLLCTRPPCPSSLALFSSSYLSHSQPPSTPSPGQVGQTAS